MTINPNTISPKCPKRKKQAGVLASRDSVADSDLEDVGRERFVIDVILAMCQRSCDGAIDHRTMATPTRNPTSPAFGGMLRTFVEATSPSMELLSVSSESIVDVETIL